MTFRFSAHVAALAVFAVLVLQQLAAQDNQDRNNNHKHHHYKLVDIGTFGGPTSLISGLVVSLNNQGMVTSCADTASPDPNYPNINAIWGQDQFIQHAFLWDDGELRDLGSLTGGTSSCGAFINRRGEISGYSTTGETDTLLGLPAVHAAVWNRGHILDLGTFGGYESVGYGINDRGVAVGGASNTISDSYTATYFNFFIQAATQVHAFLWKDGLLQDLHTLGTGTDSMAFYVNNKGQVAGQSFTDTTINVSTGLPTMHPFLWENGKMKDLGTLGGTLVTSLSALNKRGEVIGSMTLKGDQTHHPFLWDGHVLRDLGTLGGSSADAWWINDLGVVVGASFTQSDQSYLAFVWKNGVMTQIGSFAGDPCSDAQGINSAEQVVGISFDCNSGGRAFLWEEGGPLVDLQTLVNPDTDISLTEAMFINDRGEIAADGQTSSGDKHAALLIPCDENHPAIDGCDYSRVDAGGTATVFSSMPAMQDASIDTQIGPLSRSWVSPSQRFGRRPGWHGHLR